MARSSSRNRRVLADHSGSFLQSSELTPEARLGARITVQPDGCWVYPGDDHDYARVSVHGEPAVLHRFVYETLVGPVPDGMHLHHHCENKRCCNPDHLEPLTPSEHARWHRAS